MPQIEKHSPGSFCWFELATTDQNAAKRFYGSMFGWTANDSPMGPDSFYTMFQMDGREAAAAYTLDTKMRAQGVPPHWNLYIAVQSADRTADRAGQLGAQIVAPPFDVAEHGRMAVIRDTTGAHFSIWEPKAHSGTGIHGVDGAACWADLNTPDPDKAVKFYEALFGWNIKPGEHDPSGYLHIQNGTEFIGGVFPLRDEKQNIPPHWMTYFLTSDCDASAKTASELGAKLCIAPTDIPNTGRFSVISDPQGAVFAIFQQKSKE